MRKSTFFWPFVITGAIILTPNVFLSAQSPNSQSPKRKVYLSLENSSPLSVGEQVAQREGYRIVEVPESSLQDLIDEAPEAVIRKQDDLIHLEGLTFDTQKPENQGRLCKRALRLVQFKVTPGKAERRALTQAGYEILAPMARNGFLVWATGPEVSVDDEISPLVQFTGDFPPIAALNARLREKTNSSDLHRVRIRLVKDNGLFDGDLAWINETFKEATLLPVLTKGAIYIDAKVPGDRLMELAKRPTVLHVEESIVAPYLAGEASSLFNAGQNYWDYEITCDSDRPIPPMAHNMNPRQLESMGIHLTLKEKPDPNVDYLEFLEDRLGDLPEYYDDPFNYRIATLIDDGLNNGVPEAPLNPDFYYLGDKTLPSRYAFAFNNAYEITTKPPYTGEDGLVSPSEPNLFPPDAISSDYTDRILTQNSSLNPADVGYLGTTTGHGEGSASIIIGYNDVDQHSSGLLYGVGVSPYGRVASAKAFQVSYQPSGYPFLFFPYLYQEDCYYPGNATRELFLYPEDMMLHISAIHRETSLMASDLPGTAITNSSSYFARWCVSCDGNETSPVDDGMYYSYEREPYNYWYDGFCRLYDQMTRKVVFNVERDNEGVVTDYEVGETLFVTAAGNDGDLAQGASPMDQCTVWSNPDAVNIVERQSVPAMRTIVSPALAKNVLTVGGCETYDIRESKYCPQVGSFAALTGRYSGVVLYIYKLLLLDALTGSDNGQDIMVASSKGLADPDRPNNVRIKPDVVAPAQGAYYNHGGFDGNLFTGITGADMAAASPEGCIDDDFVLTPAIKGTSHVFENEQQWDATKIDYRVYTHYLGGGTSGSCPHVTGSVQVCDFFLRNYYGKFNSSPAFLKAYIIHTAQVLGGEHTGPYLVEEDHEHGNWLWTEKYKTVRIPSPYQGFGRVNLGMGLERASRHFVDQEVVLTEADDRLVLNGRVADPCLPVRATLVWTDPPADEVTDAYQNLINDLDLYVQTAFDTGPHHKFTRTYVGNEFNEVTRNFFGQPNCYSRVVKYGHVFSPEIPPVPPIEVRDTANNVECVFLRPQRFTDAIQITVQAKNLQSNALNPFGEDMDPTMPGIQLGPNQQDFALVLYNFVLEEDEALSTN